MLDVAIGHGSEKTIKLEVMNLVVNGEPHIVPADPDRPLLSVLRDELDLTGSKYGCGEAQCGACTVLIDGIPRPSCVTSISGVSGKEITTIEGLSHGERMHPVQQSFIDCEAMQCGYCTPGMIMGTVGLLQKNPIPSATEIREALQGHICRCGAYSRIVAAVKMASQRMSHEQRRVSHS